MYRLGQQKKDPAFESWSLPSVTNPHLDAAAIEAERARLPDEVYRQEYLGEFVRAETYPCDLCGGPSPSVDGLLILQGDEEVLACPECDRPVDEHGKTVVGLHRDGSVWFHIIREFGMAVTPDELTAAEQAAIRAADDALGIGPSGRIEWGTEEEDGDGDDDDEEDDDE
jgi:hypothetical protein